MADQMPFFVELSGKRRRQNQDSNADSKRGKTISTSVSPFFSLPRELRDRIYDNVWKGDDVITVEFAQCIFQVSYGLESTSKRKRKPPNPWILVNKQMLQEAMEQFHRECKWTYFGSQPITSDKLAGTTLLLLDPWKSKSLFITRCHITHVGSTEADGQSTNAELRIRDYDTTLFDRLKAARPVETTLRVLEMEFVHVARFDELAQNQVLSVTVNLSSLELLSVPSLEQVKFSFTLFKMVSASQELRERLEAEIVRVGRKMLQEAGQVKQERKSLSKFDTETWKYLWTRNRVQGTGY